MRTPVLNPRLAVLAAFLVLAAPLAAQEKPRLALEDSLTGFGLYRPEMERFRWAPDGVDLIRGRDLIDVETGKEKGQAPRPAPREKRPDGPTTREGEIGGRVSADGQWVGFVRDHDLYVRNADGKEMAVSNDGSKELLYGRLDWVYQEEVYGRGNFNAMWWSPDSKRLAFLRIDEEPVKEFTVIDHIPYTLEVEVTNYPKAGDPNPIASLGVFDVDTGKTTYVEMSAWSDDEFLIVHVGWTPTGHRVVFQIQDRIQTWLDLCYGDPKTGTVTRLIHEESDAWVNRMEEPDWLADGSFLWWSERDGYKHLYRYAADGRLMNRVTHGKWVVTDLIRKDEDAGLVWFYGRGESAVGRHAYRVGIDGKGQRMVTPGRGMHSVSFNGDGTRMIDSWSSLADPGKAVLRTAAGEEIRVLAEATFEPEHEYSPMKLIEIETRDGFKMDAAYMLPHGFDERESYPVILLTYSGPDAPSVYDRFSGNPWWQYLAQEGVIVFQVNNRTSSGKGQVATEACYKQFGVVELRDLEDAVDWLCSNSWADGNRVGISGWSYGGFMAGYALTHSKKFALGLAGAGVYDWADYDTIYTERYMSTPQKNPEGYAASSCVAAAKNLHGHLQLAHGTMDDNVHLQNTIQFVNALQKAGMDFELMLYPRSRHGVRRPDQRHHLRRLNWNAIRRVLAPVPSYSRPL